MPSFTRKSTKKRQTRLVFSPLSSSSPAAAVRYSNSDGIRVTDHYDGATTPSKRRRLDEGSDGASTGPHFAAEEMVTPPRSSNLAVVITTPSRQSKVNKDTLSLLPSPRKSSQVDLVGSSKGTSTESDTVSDSKPGKHVISNNSSRRGQANGTPKHHGGPSTPKSSKCVTDASAPLLDKGQPKPMAKLKQSRMDLSMLPAGASSPLQPELRRSHMPGVSSPIDLDSLSTPSGEDDIIPTTVVRRRAKKPAVAISSDESDPDLESPSEKTSHTDVRGSSSNVNAGPGHRMTSRVQAKTKAMSTRRTRSSVGNETSPSPEKRQTRSIARERAKLVRDTTKSESVEMSEGEDDGVPSSPAKKRHTTITASRRDRNIPRDIEEDSEDDIQPSPIRRRARVGRLATGKDDGSTERLSNALTPLKSSSQQEQEDLDEDLEDLRSSSVKTARTRVRGASSIKNEKQRQLQLLRRRRAGEKVDDLASDPDQAALPKRALYDSETAEDNSSVAADDDEFGEEGDADIETVRQSLRADADRYDEDFVVEDDHTLGAPSELEAIPLEFTRHATKKAIEHFKDAVEWMVQKKLNPAFNRDDPIYRTAFFKLDDEVKGYSGSRFMSAAWGADFSRALRARPVFCEVEIPTLFDHKCDACNRSGHPAKHKITFGGKAYHHNSLEDVSDDEEDESGDDRQSHDSRGIVIPSANVEYFVGRFCKANSETAHALNHWKYHLNQWVLDWLQNEGYATATKILEREKWSIRKKRDYANEVVDTMEQKGEIKALYRDFKHNLDAAREAKPSRYHAR